LSFAVSQYEKPGGVAIMVSLTTTRAVRGAGEGCEASRTDDDAMKSYSPRI